MRITFDSNAWETIFNPTDSNWGYLRSALTNSALEGFICESAFRIEAIKKADRAKYFARPQMGVRFKFTPTKDGLISLQASIGPKDEIHPGLPPIQVTKLELALELGVKVLRQLPWLGLPSPPELQIQSIFVAETLSERAARESRQMEVSFEIGKRLVGRSVFERLGGWEAYIQKATEKSIHKACAEWADGELVAAHMAYRNDILCTGDFGKSAGQSIFNQDNRNWLRQTYGVRIVSLEQLIGELP